MAFQKKQYRSLDKNTNRPAKRGGGMTVRLNNPHRYATRDLEKIESPTYLAACKGKKVKVKVK